MHVRLKAFAKVNLDLRILAREASGFHQLETIFQCITLADDVEVRVQAGHGIQLRCEPAVDVPDDRNLAWRAAVAYRETAQWPAPTQSIVIDIAKHIPTGGGLGGGSADAAAVLRALNALNPVPLARAALLDVAATLGADVPFLASGEVLAVAWGRGERLLALPPLPVRAVHLATFRVGVNTAAAYGALAAARTAGVVAAHGATMHTATTLHDWSHLARTACNDFETPVFALRPDVAAVHAAWRAAAPEALVRMSGSGATVFAISAAGGDDRLDAASAQWGGDGAVEVVRSTTLATLPPLAILSPSSGVR